MDVTTSTFKVVEYLGRKDVPPVVRYMFQILDHSDGQVKIFCTGMSIGNSLLRHLAEPIHVRRSHWWSRLFEWCGIIKPIMRQQDTFIITKVMKPVGCVRVPSYEVKAVEKLG